MPITASAPTYRRTTLLSRRDRDRDSPQEVGTDMRHYELMVILDPEIEERDYPVEL